MTNCVHCGATTSNGLVLCELAQMQAAQGLEFIPVYFRNLARWRPGRAGSRTVPGSRVLYDGSDREALSTGTDRVQSALEQAGNDINRLVERLTEERGLDVDHPDTEAEQVAAHCRLLAEHLATISASTWADVFLRKVTQHESTLRDLTEDVAPGWYAGGCKQCDSGTYVIPGLTWVKCRGCGANTYARDHLDTVLDEARAWVAQPMALARAIVALVDTEQAVARLHKRISKWGERKQIPVIRATRTEHVYDLDLGTMVFREVESGPKRFRLGDVLDALKRNGPTRTDSEVAKAEAEAAAEVAPDAG